MTTITVPAEITLADVAAMGEADELHRYELTDEGELRVMMTPTPEHWHTAGDVPLAARR